MAEADLEPLELHLGFEEPGRHRERVSLQAEARALYLIAWDGPQPVGHLLLKWPLPAAGSGPDCPKAEDLRVHPSFQSRGVGTALLQAAERAAIEAGYSRICLGVHPGNQRALSLYQRLGYDATLPDPGQRGIVLGPDGRASPWSEPVLFLLKRL